MKIIISPAKKMNTENDFIAPISTPIFADKSKDILNTLLTMSGDELQKLWKCNDEIALENIRRLENMDKTVVPAILAYNGLQYKHMSPSIFDKSMFEYISKNLRILSGYYGILKPFDGVSPYRLEMQANLSVNNHKNLYEFWGDKLYQEVKDDGIILNLASKEYSKCIEKYLNEADTFIDFIFGELKDNKVIQKATFAKMARGEMVNFLAKNNACDIDMIKEFNYSNFKFDNNRSTEKCFVFIKQ